MKKKYAIKKRPIQNYLARQIFVSHKYLEEYLQITTAYNMMGVLWESNQDSQHKHF